MWKKNDAPAVQNTPEPAMKTTSPAPQTPPQPASAAPPAQPPVQDRPRTGGPVSIGASVVIKGEVSAAEDLTISGRVEGKVEVRDHIVRVGREAKVQASIQARVVAVEGTVKGNITATERIELLAAGKVEGDLVAPKIAMADGAEFRGRIDMTGAAGKGEIRKSA